MSARPFGFAAMAVSLVAVPGPGAAPVTTRYVIESLTEQEVDASALGGQTQTTHLHMHSYITVTLNDTTGGKTVHAVIDSILVDSVVGIPVTGLDSVRNVAYHGLLEPSGKLSNLTPVTEVPDTATGLSLLSQLYPQLKPGVQPGDTWTDTTDVTNPIPNGSMSSRTVTNYTAAAGEPRNGGETLTIGSAFSSSVSGVQATPNGPANITGTGSGRATYYVSTDGLYLGGEVSHTANLSIDGLAPVAIPLTVRQQVTTSVIE